MSRRLKAKYKITGLTKDQCLWLQNYAEMTRTEPMLLEDLATNPANFNQVADYNVTLWEDYANEVMSDISSGIPYI